MNLIINQNTVHFAHIIKTMLLKYYICENIFVVDKKIIFIYHTLFTKHM